MDELIDAASYIDSLREPDGSRLGMTDKLAIESLVICQHYLREKRAQGTDLTALGSLELAEYIAAMRGWVSGKGGDKRPELGRAPKQA